MAEQIKEHPILFSAPMVKAILDGRKSQTRRLVKPQFGTDDDVRECCEIIKPEGWQGAGHSGLWAHEGDYEMQPRKPLCVPGDRLWVKETWQDYCPLWHGAWCGHGTQEGKEKEHQPAYKADPEEKWIRNGGPPKKWRPSIFMPRWASRITLEVTEVHVQRLQEISEEDAKAEGLLEHKKSDRSGSYYGAISWHLNPKDAFQELWDSINGKTAPWASNPWVWAYNFRRVK